MLFRSGIVETQMKNLCPGSIADSEQTGGCFPYLFSGKGEYISFGLCFPFQRRTVCVRKGGEADGRGCNLEYVASVCDCTDKRN